MAGVRKKATSSAAAAVTHPRHESPTKTSTITTDSDLGYKIRVLLYDFRNIRTDHTSRKRISLTIDPLYISTPYFTQEEAARVKAAIVDINTEVTEYSDGLNYENEEKPISASQSQTVEDMLQANFANFLDKRRAGGDSRPCGPHDMAPLYESVFGASRAELQDENFLCRLRKSGLKMGQKQNKSADEIPSASGKKKRGGH